MPVLLMTDAGEKKVFGLHATYENLSICCWKHSVSKRLFLRNIVFCTLQQVIDSNSLNSHISNLFSYSDSNKSGVRLMMAQPIRALQAGFKNRDDISILKSNKNVKISKPKWKFSQIIRVASYVFCSLNKMKNSHVTAGLFHTTIIC